MTPLSRPGGPVNYPGPPWGIPISPALPSFPEGLSDTSWEVGSPPRRAGRGEEALLGGLPTPDPFRLSGRTSQPFPTLWDGLPNPPPLHESLLTPPDPSRAPSNPSRFSERSSRPAEKSYRPFTTSWEGLPTPLGPAKDLTSYHSPSEGPLDSSHPSQTLLSH